MHSSTNLGALGASTVVAALLIVGIEWIFPATSDLFSREIIDGISFKAGAVYAATSLIAYVIPVKD